MERIDFGRALAAAAIFAIAACGGTEQTTNTPVDTGNSGKQTSSPDLDAEIGGMEEAKVQSAFERTSGKLTACFTEGTKRIPFLGGDVRFALRVGKDGTARVAYLKESTLGDRETEACMLGAVRAASWPAPVGGKEGLAEGGFSFDPSADERPAVALDADKLGKELPKAKDAIARCRSSVGGGPVKVTMYIGTNGKPIAVGLSSADDKGEEAASCIVDALREMKFPSPGSYAGKVTITTD
ncbi:AgmX/PglI C-terminal domain-containing protein [Polyangium aurulentum]|uniref:AgmX/PglI C-terminal domain-containing protein n=1 Tax=Polyangium aurulentum TaxID=2567896 RepID=UPI0010ADF3ED|nr:AgmX/PglI C-terminal domain-containing protein [Polyangium aurulentum]UQA58668.1 AgmX/PglI C-terminal domain-containing protein [Polyangium aurulentum]